MKVDIESVCNIFVSFKTRRVFFSWKKNTPFPFSLLNTFRCSCDRPISFSRKSVQMRSFFLMLTATGTRYNQYSWWIYYVRS